MMQMGELAKVLHEVQPGAKLTREDFIDYYSLNYVTNPKIADEALAFLDEYAGFTTPGERLRNFLECVPEVLGDHTTPAVMERVYGGLKYLKADWLTGGVQLLKLQPELTEFVDVFDEPTYRVGVMAKFVRPEDGVEILYCGQDSLPRAIGSEATRSHLLLSVEGSSVGELTVVHSADSDRTPGGSDFNFSPELTLR